jgi:3-methyladenine DNA glycosylase AlkC
MPTTSHPISRFHAPSSITAGSSLADLLDERYLKLLAESLSSVLSPAIRRAFLRDCTHGLADLALIPRARHIAEVMTRYFPATGEKALAALIDSLGPELTSSEGNGLRVFYYFPHSCFIASFAQADFAAGMLANYELTKRFTAEFSLRPYLIHHQDAALKQLRKWTKDKNVHVRRLVSEGSRPRLPWGQRLPAFMADPTPTLALLELLKDDSERYVTRSVANHLGDVAKDHLPRVIDHCEKWLAELPKLTDDQANERKWMIRHALRHPAKKGHADALRVQRQAR